MSPNPTKPPTAPAEGSRGGPSADSPLEVGVSVVIPVFRAESILPVLISRLETVLGEYASAYEVILVNDASPDGSWEVIEQIVQDCPNVQGINLMRNYGQHGALLCGIRAAKFGVTVTMDDDLQHLPEELPKLLNELEKGYDVVYGTPEKEQHGFLRDVASRLTKLALQSTMGAKTARKVSALRAFRTDVRSSFQNYRGPWVSIDVLLTWGAGRFGAIPLKHDPRQEGTSNYTFISLVSYALNMVVGFSTVPLQFASLVGFTFTLFGFGVLAYVVGSYLVEGSTVAGFPFLASVIAIFSGAQLFALGIIGEYLARMHLRMMDRPAYIVRERLTK